MVHVGVSKLPWWVFLTSQSVDLDLRYRELIRPSKYGVNSTLFASFASPVLEINSKKKAMTATWTRDFEICTWDDVSIGATNHFRSEYTYISHSTTELPLQVMMKRKDNKL